VTLDVPCYSSVCCLGEEGILNLWSGTRGKGRQADDDRDSADADPVLHRGRGPGGRATWVLTLSRHTPRQVAYRIAVTFGVFGVAAGYVWLDLGSDLDAAPAAHDRPPLAAPDRTAGDV
jgi:hypothetical protein